MSHPSLRQKHASVRSTVLVEQHGTPKASCYSVYAAAAPSMQALEPLPFLSVPLLSPLSLCATGSCPAQISNRYASYYILHSHTPTSSHLYFQEPHK